MINATATVEVVFTFLMDFLLLPLLDYCEDCHVVLVVVVVVVIVEVVVSVSVVAVDLAVVVVVVVVVVVIVAVVVRDRPKFTGYPGRVLGNFTVEKNY